MKNKCGHDGTFIYMGQARYLRGYLLTYCLDCEKTIKAEVIKMREDSYNPNNQRVQEERRAYDHDKYI